MTPAELKQWMQDKGYTKAALHRATSVSRVTLDSYLSGKRSIPAVFELALKGLQKAPRTPS